jgi:hypothetical protein
MLVGLLEQGVDVLYAHVRVSVWHFLDEKFLCCITNRKIAVVSRNEDQIMHSAFFLYR